MTCLRYWVGGHARRWLPLRPGIDPRPRPPRQRAARAAGRRDRSPRTACWPTPSSSPSRGTPPGCTRSARFPLAGAGANGTASIATTSAASGAASRASPARWPRACAAVRDLYQNTGRLPRHSINFITCHDGFTLYDLVSYNHKHNVANGEDNRDGTIDNFSWNCGVEGETDDPEIQSPAPPAGART